jgi:hypothetical protein
MHPVIQLLETLAVHPYGHVGPASEIASPAVEPALRDAVVIGDAKELRRLLGAQAAMACLIVAPDNDEQRPDEEPGDANDAPDEQENKAA